MAVDTIMNVNALDGAIDISSGLFVLVKIFSTIHQMLFSYKTESVHYARPKTDGLVKSVTPRSLYLSVYHFITAPVQGLKELF